MKKTLLVLVLVALPLLPLSAAERSMEDLRNELSALTEAISAQTKLLEIYERLRTMAEPDEVKKELAELSQG